ncbi:hypothetical protein HUW46_08330 [Amycolatopsis sp. CA-230715]|nr:hypothetical protein HUW46_08330 [Amycolatopsis sp. CA-230715]
MVVAGLAITLGTGSAAFASTESHPGGSRPGAPIACHITVPLPPGTPAQPAHPVQPAHPTDAQPAKPVVPGTPAVPGMPIGCWVSTPLPPGTPTLPTLPPGAEPTVPTTGAK